MLQGVNFAKNHEKTMIFEIEPFKNSLSGYLSTFLESKKQDRHKLNTLQYFLGFFLGYRGLRGVVLGGNFAKNHQKTVIFAIEPFKKSLNGCLSTFLNLRNKIDTN